MTNKNYWLKSGFYSLLNQLTQMLFNLGSVMILYRVLEKETASVWVLFLTITAFIEVSRTGLLQNGLMTFLNTTPQSEHSKINTASLVLSLALSVVIALSLLVFSGQIGVEFKIPQLATLLTIYAGTTLVLSPLYQFNFIQQANMDFKGLFWSTFVRNGTLFFYILYLFVTEGGIQLVNLAWVQFFAALPAALVGLSFAKKYFQLSKSVDFQWVKKLLTYGKYTFGTNLATMTQKSVDRILLGGMLLGQLSTYDLSIRVNTLAEVPTMTLASIMFPKSVQRTDTEGGAGAKYLYEKSLGVLLAILLPVVITVLLGAEVIVWILGSEKYAAAVPVLRLTIFYGVFMAFAMQFGTIMDSVGKPKLNFIITSIGALLNLACNYLFIKAFGLYGAAYGTLTAMSIMFVVMQWILRGVFGVDLLQIFRYIPQFYKEIMGTVSQKMSKPVNA
jgi:lipopolysaccharide exporter